MTLTDTPAPAQIVAYIDGGARGNPGPAGFGVRIERPDGTLVDEMAESIGTATNNVAEYSGLIAALEWARAHGCRVLHIRSDSLLLVQQMLGKYRSGATPAASSCWRAHLHVSKSPRPPSPRANPGNARFMSSLAGAWLNQLSICSRGKPADMNLSRTSMPTW